MIQSNLFVTCIFYRQQDFSIVARDSLFSLLLQWTGLSDYNHSSDLALRHASSRAAITR